MERPALRSTIKLSSVTTRLCARTSASKVLIPTPNQLFSIVFCQLLDAVEFTATKTAAALQSHWIEPELGNSIIAFNVDMFWFVAITGVEEETIRSNS